MKDFSNEAKSKRRKAILKVILKRYSFIVWLPALLVVSNFIGMITLNKLALVPVKGVSIYILNTIMGFMIIVLIILICCIIGCFIKYLKEVTIEKDFIDNVKFIREALVEILCFFIINNVKRTIEILVDILRFFITLPKRIFLRIKDEKRRFNNSVEKEMRRDVRYS